MSTLISYSYFLRFRLEVSIGIHVAPFKSSNHSKHVLHVLQHGFEYLVQGNFDSRSWGLNPRSTYKGEVRSTFWATASRYLNTFSDELAS